MAHGPDACSRNPPSSKIQLSISASRELPSESDIVFVNELEDCILELGVHALHTVDEPILVSEISDSCLITLEDI